MDTLGWSAVVGCAVTSVTAVAVSVAWIGQRLSELRVELERVRTEVERSVSARAPSADVVILRDTIQSMDSRITRLESRP